MTFDVMKELLYSIWSKFLVWFSKIKIVYYHYLPVLVYYSDENYVTGYDITEIMKIVLPGDVIIRGFDEYLDGKFVPDEFGYSHAGLYVGNN